MHRPTPRLRGKAKGKLTQLRSGLSVLPATLAYMPTDERERDRYRDQQHWRKWYRTARWKRLRWSVLVRDRFTCQRCKRVEANTSQLVANHKTPHRGDEALFWNEGNLETACKPCHDGLIQSEERRGEG